MTVDQCPVCKRHVSPTGGGNVYRHRDKAGKNCPMSGKPFALVIETETEVA